MKTFSKLLFFLHGKPFFKKRFSLKFEKLKHMYFQNPEVDEPNLRRPEPPGLYHHVRGHHLSQVHKPGVTKLLQTTEKCKKAECKWRRKCEYSRFAESL